MTADQISEFVRFMTMVWPGEKVGECWEWTGNRPDGRYGHFSVGSKAIKAHRWLYEFFNGPIPEGLVVRHRCDNPACVNPLHLHVGTLADNTADAVERGRWSDRAGVEHPLARLTETDVLGIRSDARCGLTHQTIAGNYGISRQQVGKIIRRENWSHI